MIFSSADFFEAAELLANLIKLDLGTCTQIAYTELKRYFSNFGDITILHFLNDFLKIALTPRMNKLKLFENNLLL